MTKLQLLHKASDLVSLTRKHYDALNSGNAQEAKRLLGLIKEITDLFENMDGESQEWGKSEKLGPMALGFSFN
jgi:cobalamin biosynthesis protein CobT